jgi:hypothetical protein
MTDLAALYRVVLIGVATGAISLLVTKSALLAPFHKWLGGRSPFLEELLSCPWCTSHWVGFLLMLVYRPLLLGNPVGWPLAPVDWAVTLMAVVFVASLAAGAMYRALSPIMGG